MFIKHKSIVYCMEVIEEIKETKEVTRFVSHCEICGKEITGTSEGQVRFNLIVHKQSKECKKDG